MNTVVCPFFSSTDSQQWDILKNRLKKERKSDFFSKKNIKAQGFDRIQDFLYLKQYALTINRQGHMLDINITLLIQLVNFIVTLVVLDFLLIKPIRGIIKKRRDLASGMLSDAESFTTEAAAKLEDYEAALAKAREEAAAVRETRKNEAHAKETDILEAARKNAQEFLQTSRGETRASVAETMAAMEKRIPELSSLVVDKLLGKSNRSSAA